MTAKRYNTYCDQNENRTVLDDDLNNTHIFLAYCGELEDAIRLKIALNSVTDELNALHEENEQLRKEKECDKQIFTKKRLHELLQQTQKENEHIKQTIKTMMENERTELGQSVLRQLQEAIK